MTASKEEYLVTKRPERCPTHPGQLLRNVVLPALDLGVKEAAAEMRVSRQTLHRIMSGGTAVTPEMAVRLGKFCGNGPDIWLRMQQAHDLWHAKQALSGELARIPCHASKAA